MASAGDGRKEGEWGGSSIPCLSFVTVFGVERSKVLRKVREVTVGKQRRL